MNYIGEIIPLLLIFTVVTMGYIKDLPVFTLFKEGAKDGIITSVKLLPTLIGILCGIKMLTASGAISAIVNLIEPITVRIGLPGELLPLVILKPISGSGANGVLIELFEEFGTDSKIGQMASIMTASTETTFYAIAVYFAAKNYKSIKYTVPVALTGDLVTFIMAIVLTNISL